MTENEVSWSRGKRETEVSDSKDAYLYTVPPDERTTGSMMQYDLISLIYPQKLDFFFFCILPIYLVADNKIKFAGVIG